MAETLHQIRLRNDYEKMMRMSDTVITVTPSGGTPPYVNEYDLTVNVRSITGPAPTYRNQHHIKLRIPNEYPERPPLAFMTDAVVYHPNWFTSDNRWCYGSWDMQESLAAYVLRMVRTLQYDKEITNERSPANVEAKNWYVSQRSSGLFPCDTTPLPDPDAKPRKFVIKG